MRPTRFRRLDWGLPLALAGLCGLGAALEAQENSVFDRPDQLWVVGDIAYHNQSFG